MTRLALRCSGLAKSFNGTAAVRNVSVDVEEGRFLALLGPSGCGKTTLLRLIAGFETPDAGTIEILGKAVAGPAAWVPPEKRRVGIVFQDYALFPHMDVARNIAYGLPGEKAAHRVSEMLSLVGLGGFARRMPHELSGGEQQRVAIARALAPAPDVLLLDEPFSSLDADLRARVRADIKTILTTARSTVIFVTHDQEEALFMGDRVGVMNSGRLEQVAAPQEIFHCPATPFVAQFVGIADFIDGETAGSQVLTEVGQLPLRCEFPPGTKVRVMLRPDVVALRADPAGAGEVVGRVFQGIHYLYHVRLGSGAMIRSLQHHDRDYPAGTRVAITLDESHQAVCFPSH
ncbi:MAG: ABC transporter ATP-binding protein [Chloroflexi bacterium]|nr:ABC transporter ATP-binding protein [Chloroflexota bacterium]